MLGECFVYFLKGLFHTNCDQCLNWSRLFYPGGCTSIYRGWSLSKILHKTKVNMEYTGTYGTDAVLCYSPFKTRSAKRFSLF